MNEISWENVAIEIFNHSEADISHGICPDCFEERYPEYSQKEDQKKIAL